MCVFFCVKKLLSTSFREKESKPIKRYLQNEMNNRPLLKSFTMVYAQV